MPVQTPHKEYTLALSRWKLVDDIVNNDATCHIRTVDPNDPMRSMQYKNDAVLTNFTRLTEEGLTGLVFRKETTKELPLALQYLDDDATGMNFTLDQLLQKTVAQILRKGRFGLLADMPRANEYDSADNKIARIKAYTAENIINWGYQDYGNEYKLSLVVLREDVSYLNEDGFDWICAYQYRVLRLVDGVYRQEIWRQSTNNNSSAFYDLNANDITYPTDYNGNNKAYIPFVFLGSENNNSDIDAIPLYDLAVVNLGHYRNSADCEETSFIAGQVQPVTNVGESMSAEEFALANPGGILIGSRRNIVLGYGGDFNFRQAMPNILPQSLMKDKENQAAAIGARLIAPPGSGRESAEGVRVRYSSQNSRLHIITKNVGEAFEQLLDWIAADMMESPELSVVVLNDQFYEEGADPTLIAQEILLFDRGGMSLDEIRTNMKLSGIKLDENFTPDPTAVDPLAGVSDVTTG